MGVRERKIREKESMRRKILDAARGLFVQEGYEHFTMRTLADRIEYTPTTIYLYFKDKDELIGEVCEESFRGLLKQLERIKGKYEDPVEAVRTGCRAYVDFGLAHSNHYKMSFMSAMPAVTSEEVERLNRKYPAGMAAYNFLRTAVETCIEQGRFRKVEVDAATQAIWAAIHGITSLLIVKAAFNWVKRDRLIDLLIDTMIQGMKP